MKPLSSAYISIEQLYLAYRKAKIDVFFERSQPTALAFLDCEKALEKNLEIVATRLTAPRPDWFSDPEFIGSIEFIPKHLSVPDLNANDQPHFCISEPKLAWEHLLRRRASRNG